MYRRRKARFGSSARSSRSLVAASGVTWIVVVLPSMAIELSLPVLLQLRHASQDRGEAGEYPRARSGDGHRGAENDRRSTEERAVQHTHALRAEGISTHDPAADVVGRRELDLRVGERLCEHRGGTDDHQQQERRGVVRREREHEDREHLGHRCADDEAAAVASIPRVRQVESRRDGADAAADQEERVSEVVDVQHVVREQDKERIEGMAEEDDAEHLDPDERGEVRTPANEAEAIAERGTDRCGGPGAERSQAYEPEEDEKRDEGERVDQEAPPR